MGRSGGACRKKRGDIHGRSLCISHGQNRAADCRNPENGRSPVRYKAARNHTAVRTVHHSLAQKFQNNPLHNGNNPNLAGGGAGKWRLAVTCWIKSLSEKLPASTLNASTHTPGPPLEPPMPPAGAYTTRISILLVPTLTV